MHWRDHRITTWFEMEGAFKGHPAQLSAVNCGIFAVFLAKAHSNIAVSWPELCCLAEQPVSVPWAAALVSPLFHLFWKRGMGWIARGNTGTPTAPVTRKLQLLLTATQINIFQHHFSIDLAMFQHRTDNHILKFALGAKSASSAVRRAQSCGYLL